MTQTVDECGYIITFKNNLRGDVESDIVKDMNKGKGEKHAELKLWIKDLITLQKNMDEEYYSFCGIRMNIVDIYGVIVSVKSNKYGILYKVDDGTGEIDCWRDSRSEMHSEKLCQFFGQSEYSFEEVINPNKTAMESSIFAETTEDFSTTYNCEKEIEVEQWLREQILEHVEKDSLSLGDTVHLRGKLADFRGERCIRIYNIRHVIDINEETDRRLELIHLYQTVYLQKKSPQTSVRT